jgi:hypothetical protein
MWAAILALVPALVHPQARVGPDIAVNEDTLGRQDSTAVATDADGNFVVVWRDVAPAGGAQAVFARRFDTGGAPLGSEWQVNTYATVSLLNAPDVAVAPTGDFLVVWDGRADGSGSGVFAQRFDAGGAAQGAEFRVNAATLYDQASPSIAANDSGEFVVAWTSGGDIVARRFDAAGNAFGPELTVSEDGTATHVRPAVAADAAGSFVVVWSTIQGGSSEISGRRFDAAGLPMGPEFRVNTVTSGLQVWPAVAVAPDGRFVVLWTAFGEADIHGRRYDATGVAAGPQFVVNAYTTLSQYMPTVAIDGDGGFLATWVGHVDGGGGTSDAAIIARRFDGSGAPAGIELRVNAYTTGSQTMPAIAAQPDGEFVVTWQSLGQDGDDWGVFAQRIVEPVDAIFADGFESGTFAAWSFVNDDGGDLSVTGAAALNGTTVGLQAFVDDTAGLFVEDASPQDEDRYRARFYFDPSGFDPGESAGHFRTRIFVAFSEAPSRRLLAIVLQRREGEYRVMARARLDADGQVDTPWVPIADGPHFVEIDFHRAIAGNQGDGFLHLWVDGVLGGSLTTLRNSRAGVDFVRLGALSVKGGASGTLYFDQFVSRRTTAIGP